MLAGAAGKDICLHKIGEGKVLGLFGRYTTTHNQSLDESAKNISGKRMTEGVPSELIDKNPSDEEDLCEQRIAEAKSVAWSRYLGIFREERICSRLKLELYGSVRLVDHREQLLRKGYYCTRQMHTTVQ
eukprot:Plantae.Rhodophyta-Hildenbrandia_rubra.ctg36575.p1 GENE.Plantae.Rhodophyta-Hildenbrandia_rubra.ctg36575~~Plantae.Rhodophyta-Hildenbrandia_rubra.ctg36575.p1  ORF type:complete len:129 (+),score=14.19 Plantae.Rhodophyta-Hildenbrandia_rubra.ctg36575:360-746(+)